MGQWLILLAHIPFQNMEKLYMHSRQININVLDDFSITMAGSVTRVAEGRLSKELFD